MKKILGLDLGTTSVGWAMVTQADNNNERSSILGCGSRVVPISVDEKDSFEKGKASTTNANRTLKRGMRRNLQRRKQRRDNLVAILKQQGWITDTTLFSEVGKGSTYDTLHLRAKAATEQITLSELARVFLAICKKRGYKSSRKIDADEDGQLIDGMQIAKSLFTDGITPAQYAKKVLDSGKAARFDFYRSDLEAEFDRIWNNQKQYYPSVLTDDFKKQLARQGRSGSSKLFFSKYTIYTADNKGKERKVQAIEWRIEALSKKLQPEVMAYVISDIRGEIYNSSGYLGEISDRSKELFFSGETIGQYLYRSLQENPQFSTRNKVFYRQDYIDEFNIIWEVQSQFHPELTPKLKKIISDEIIFYQRHLKSQKGLISFCEFESRKIKVLVDGKEKTKTTGSRVAPRSSLLFQEFKIWQVLNNLAFIDRATGISTPLSIEEKSLLAKELTIKARMRHGDVLKLFGKNGRRYKLNYESIEGNNTIAELYAKYIEIIADSGHDTNDLEKMSYHDASAFVTEVLSFLGCSADIFSFNSSLHKEEYEQQPLFKLWHLLYSYEGDNSNTGNESLIAKISEITGLERDYAKVISTVKFKQDYASLSHKAISKILPFLKEGYCYSDACKMAGYNHSHSLTQEELDNKDFVDRLEILPKGALRNPVVEKIINQMINVVNAASDAYGKPDEIHIELARELKQNAKEREKATNAIAANNRKNEEYEEILRSSFGLKSVRKADILRYRLYDELKENGYKTLYSNKFISPSILFSKEIDIEHIIPQALMFDDSFVNKTLEFKDINIEKGRKTANDYVKGKYGTDEYEQYRLRIDDLASRGAISDKKRKYLLMTESEIPSGFIDRDLRNSQYISKKALEILQDYVRDVVPTTGSVTSRLREEWQLVDVMKEINFEKYQKAGKTYIEEDTDGRKIQKIENWTKRNDHRHHAMDAITIAFTRPEHINILNNLHAKSDKGSSFYGLYLNHTVDTGKKRIFTPPMPLDELRQAFKKSLDAAIISIKAKNKVVTRNVNRTKKANGENKKIELTPRGELHKEQVYGRRQRYATSDVTVGAKMNADVILTVASKKIREALQARLDENGGDSKRAFTGKNSLEKNPLYIDAAHTIVVPPKVKCVRFDTYFSIRKDVAPDLSVDKIVDKKAQAKIKARIAECNGDVREALTNLEQKPIWLDDAHTIPIKKVTIGENFDLYAIRDKRDKDGKLIMDKDGNTIPNDYVNLRNNHHVALYRDTEGQIQEVVVPMFEALNRVNMHLPIVDKTHKSDSGWTFLYSIKVNEMFVFPDEQSGFYPQEINLLNPANLPIISRHLFRVQKLAKRDYWFRHHLETTIDGNDKQLKGITWNRITNIQLMNNVVKVRVNHIGQIVAVGEYD
ncbi:MAG: type II CRISPR RNA-guided endonuclease Cas9 [Bacteroidales bacterium]|nr:type II CRISPR RNA-guided endonuclease Cas9 [Bacteroidales bacterium]